MSEHIRVLLADDHDLAREGLSRILKMEPGIEVVGQAKNGADAIVQAEALSPDIILMDIKMPQMNGIEATRRIRDKNLPSAIIFMSFYDEFVAEAIDVGASGYLTKDVSGARLITAIRDVYHGGRVLDVSAMSMTSHVDDWLGDSGIDEGQKAGSQDEVAPVSPEPVEDKPPVVVSQRIPLDLVIPPSSNSSMVLQLLDSLGQQLKVVILEVGGSPMTGTVVKILANNPSTFHDELAGLEQVSKVIATSNEMVLASADGTAEATVTFTFHVELNDPNAKGPLHMAEWPNLAWASAAKKQPNKASAKKGWFWAS